MSRRSPSLGGYLLVKMGRGTSGFWGSFAVVHALEATTFALLAASLGFARERH